MYWKVPRIDPCAVNSGGAVATEIVERADVRVIERRYRPRFAFESLPRAGLVAHARAEDLDRHDAIEPRIDRAVHLAHTAGPKRCLDFVGTEARACVQRHR